MDALFRTHRFLVDHLDFPVERLLMQEIDWDQTLIGIKGSRGVGKTSFLLSYAKKFSSNDRSCLYINLNNFYFTQRTLSDFCDEFHKKGGRTLIIDQVFKYPNWSHELSEIHEALPNLKIIFAGSTVMRLKEENPDLAGKVAVYNLRGFSLREFINQETGNKFKAYSLDEILNDHQAISKLITSEIRPLAYFHDYLHHGYYPFYLDKGSYSETLLKTMNLMLEIDVTFLQQIELKYLPKLRTLLYLLAINAPSTPNVSQLSAQISTSRATVMNYIKYLKDARIFNFLYPIDADYPKKPDKIYLHNTNLAYAIDRDFSDKESLCETFFYNMLHAQNKVNSGTQGNQFLINKQLDFKVETSMKNLEVEADLIYAVDMIEKGKNNIIPLWMFGFLY